MKLFWINVVFFASSVFGQNFTMATPLQVAVEPTVDAHTFALQKIHNARSVTKGVSIPFLYCTAASTPCQSFQIADDGSFVGDHLTEHDALLLLVAEQEMTVARQEQAQQRALKVRTDPPPLTLKSREGTYSIRDRDIWNAYVLGDTNCQARDIRILNSNPKKRVTVLHEMEHVATNCSNEKGLHRLINQMTPKLLELMRENPDVVAYLMQNPDYER